MWMAVVFTGIHPTVCGELALSGGSFFQEHG